MAFAIELLSWLCSQGLIGTLTVRRATSARSRRRGGAIESKDLPHAPALTHEPGDTLPSEIEAVRETVPVARG
jgi:hypothetical protein